MIDPVRGKGSQTGEDSGARDDATLVARGNVGHGGVWLAEVLDSEYARYEPDTRRIRTLLDERLEDDGGAARGAGRFRVPVLGLRLAGIPAGIAAAALCATVAVAVTATVANDQPHSTSRAATNSGGGLPAASSVPSGGGGHSQAGSPASATHGGVTGQGAQTATKPAGTNAGPSASSGSAPPPGSGSSLVSATGSLASSSNAQWTEEDVNITLQDPVSALQLIVRVTPSTGYSQERYWSNHDIAAFNVSVNSDASGLVYTYTLKPGNIIQAGIFTIAAQFTHSSPHDASGDTYSVSVTTDQAHGSAPAVSQGSF